MPACPRGRTGPSSSHSPATATIEDAAKTVRQPSQSPNTGSTAVETSTSRGNDASRMPKARTRGVRASRSTRILEELGSESTRRKPAAASTATNHAVLGACDSATANKPEQMHVSRPMAIPPMRSVIRPPHTANTTAGTADSDRPSPSCDELMPRSSRRYGASGPERICGMAPAASNAPDAATAAASVRVVLAAMASESGQVPGARGRAGVHGEGVAEDRHAVGPRQEHAAHRHGVNPLAGGGVRR